MGELMQSNPRMQRLAIAMLVVAALLAVDALYQAGRSIHWWWWLSSAQATEVSTTQPADTQPAGSPPAGTQPAGSQPAGSRPATTQSATKPAKAKKKPKGREIHAAIKKRNVFAKPKKKGHGRMPLS